MSRLDGSAFPRQRGVVLLALVACGLGFGCASSRDGNVPPTSDLAVGVAFVEAYADGATYEPSSDRVDDTAQAVRTLAPKPAPARFALEGLIGDDLPRDFDLAATDRRFADEGGVSLGSIARVLWARDPEIEAARARLRAAETQIETARFLEEAREAYRAFSASGSSRPGPPRNGRAMREWMAPADSTLRAAWIEADIDRALAALRGVVIERVAAVERAAAHVAFARTRQAIVRESLTWHERWLPSMEDGVATGRESLANLYNLRIEIARLETRDRENEAELEARGVELGRRWIRERGAPIAEMPIAFPDTTDEPMLSSEEDRTRWIAAALDRRPDIRGARAMRRAMEAAVRLAEFLVTPRPETVVKRRPTASTALFGTRRALLEEMRQRLEATEARVKALEVAIPSEVFEAATRYDHAVRELRSLERDRLPLADESLDAVSLAYEGNRSSFLELLEAARLRLDLQLAAAAARRDLRLRSADRLVSLGLRPTQEGR